MEKLVRLEYYTLKDLECKGYTRIKSTAALFIYEYESILYFFDKTPKSMNSLNMNKLLHIKEK